MIFSGWSSIYLFRFDGVKLPGGEVKAKNLLIADVVGAYSGVSSDALFHAALPVICHCISHLAVI